VEVDTGALRRNFDRLAERAGGASHVLVMIKADAYGVGMLEVAQAVREAGAWGLGVAAVSEGAELREAGSEERIVVFSACPPIDAEAVVELDLEPAISSVDGLRAYADAARPDRPVLVHLEVDTGMGRLGLPADRAGAWSRDVAGVVETGRVRVASTFTHFHSAGSDEASVREQWLSYREALEAMRAAGLEPGLLHAANSPALLGPVRLPADLARPGIHLYGGGPHGAEPVVSVRARVLDVRTLAAGHAVSYGATWRTGRETRLATLAIGYADGLPWRLSSRGAVLLSGRKAPIRGSVCMDMTVVEVPGGHAVRPGDVATVLGEDGGERIGLAELARGSGSMEYEILTGWSERLPRVYVET